MHIDRGTRLLLNDVILLFVHSSFSLDVFSGYADMLVIVLVLLSGSSTIHLCGWSVRAAWHAFCWCFCHWQVLNYGRKQVEDQWWESACLLVPVV